VVSALTLDFVSEAEFDRVVDPARGSSKENEFVIRNIGVPCATLPKTS
jgi:hypothetical protein